MTLRRPPPHGLAVTGWFDGAATVPGRRGVYERRTPLAPYSYWTGAHWCHCAQSADRAEWFCAIESIDQSSDWRGLASEPQP